MATCNGKCRNNWWQWKGNQTNSETIWWNLFSVSPHSQGSDVAEKLPLTISPGTSKSLLHAMWTQQLTIALDGYHTSIDATANHVSTSKCHSTTTALITILTLCWSHSFWVVLKNNIFLQPIYRKYNLTCISTQNLGMWPTDLCWLQ